MHPKLIHLDSLAGLAFLQFQRVGLCDWVWTVWFYEAAPVFVPVLTGNFRLLGLR